MIESLESFAERLNAMDPDDDAFVLRVDDLVEKTNLRLLESIYPIVFRFFEAHPESYCGMPGTLVHVIEDYYPNYVDELIDSVSRAPSTNTVLMVNRILNSQIDSKLRHRLLQCLKDVTMQSNVSTLVQDEARSFWERHT
jgi:hypothetical protein